MCKSRGSLRIQPYVRLKTRRYGSKDETNISPSSQTLPSAVEKHTLSPVSVEQHDWLDYDSYDWERVKTIPPMDIESQCPSGLEDIGLDFELNDDAVVEKIRSLDDPQWWNSVAALPLSSSKPKTQDDNASIANSLQELTSQAMSVSVQVLSATRVVMHPHSAPPTVSSVHINEAFEGTRTLVRIMNSMLSRVSPGDDGDSIYGARSFMAADIGGLVLTTLACHQHLLNFFKGVCNTIELCVESVANGKRLLDCSGGSFLNGDGAPSTAQFAMVLQLLVHLVGRLDRCLFLDRALSLVSSSSTSAYGFRGHEADNVMSGTVGIPSLALSLVSRIPDDHLRLRQTISQLQTRMERLEEF
ncbi:hypothetical protein F66182_1563 [Fusarium sp. NRRL 66182]|nr:hypothetical protein F66182_1563 [Fusarium sp. NRRL 66182]